MTGDPVSWLMVEPGWDVVASDGSEVGRVESVVGDTSKDIFSGLAISSGLLAGLVEKPKFVPAERIRSITEGRIEVDLPPEAVDGLDDHAPAPPPEDLR
ncbi:MAG TPA: PRC-barrel domain-containing protein [Gaiellaceae bacterium]|nr:PRC-barrel domain-containing protein [Gaiellaceae bacterium]HEX2496508.1 PRC-barrel domain-containing protein [Gaiellaceae bacterium]